MSLDFWLQVTETKPNLAEAKIGPLMAPLLRCGKPQSYLQVSGAAARAAHPLSSAASGGVGESACFESLLSPCCGQEGSFINRRKLVSSGQV